LLRNNEYYNIQDALDLLYEQSKDGRYFKNLYDLIISEQNIMLAYRNIKNNKGSNTAGTDGLVLSDIDKMDENLFIRDIQKRFENYQPKSVRRVEIPKNGGGLRPLGIPCMHDRIIQQCIKQILEPICEAKFHKHSYDFRPNRGTEHAIARAQALINNAYMNYVVDIDIKGFFDNVNHSKLMKQLWSIGIQDKKVLSIIKKILNSEVEGQGKTTKGTPQGGIISPLLSNVVLNELDWWLSSQWETFKAKFPYTKIGNQQQALKKTNLKEFFFVRYADDFKVFCRDYETAQKVFIAVKEWLKIRLKLDISPEKSKVTNLRKNYTVFLGIKMKAIKKKSKYVCYSRMSDKAKANVYKNLVHQVKVIQKIPTGKEVQKLNSMILGIHNYYRVASHITKDMREIDFWLRKVMYNRLKHNLTNEDCRSKFYLQRYGQYNHKLITVGKVTIFPVYGCTNKIPLRFNPDICNYTKKGRELIHKKLSETGLIEYLIKVKINSMSVELYDNCISLMAAQNGKCFVTNEPLQINNMELHHKIMKSTGGDDSYKNLVWVSKDIHKLIHSTKEETISNYMNKIKLDKNQLDKLNKLRVLVGNNKI